MFAMTLRENLPLALANDLKELANKLDQAQKGKAGELIAEFKERYGFKTDSRVYNHLKAIGWDSGRKRRADSGKTKLPEESLYAIGAALRTGLRENGKQTLETPNAISLLSQNGIDIPVGESRVRQLLKRHNLNTASAKQSSPSVTMRSLYPNHVHQVDPSLCLIYYTPDGKQHVLHDDEIYKNKPEWAEKLGNLKCWRYVLVDHRSAVVIVRYYAAKGETQANLYDFLLYCWQKTSAFNRCFHGVPKLLVWDKGSANGAAAIQNALRALNVESYAHAKGNARAKGGVEGSNNLVEKLFEARLRFEPVRNIDELNKAAERWYQAFNANAIPRLDTRLRRPGMLPAARYALWQMIRAEQLRILPDDDTCRYLLTAEPEDRTVRGTAAGGLSIQFAHPVSKRTEYYDLSHVNGVVKGMKVKVSPLIYGQNQVLVAVEDYKGDVTHHQCDPVKFDEAGQRADAAVWGENYKANPHTAVEQAAKRAEAISYPGMDEKEKAKAKAKGVAPFGGLDAHSHLEHVYLPEYMDRKGTTLEVENPVKIEARTLSATDLCMKLKDQMGKDWTPEFGKQIFSAYLDGAQETELATLAERLMTGEINGPKAHFERPRLVAIK